MPDQIDLSKMESEIVMGSYGYPRLVRYWREADSDLWSEIWRNSDAEALWGPARKGGLPIDYEKIFTKHLKPEAKVLEAGCGLGQVVIALRARGFDCVGLDYAIQTVNLLNEKLDEKVFHHGDIRDIPFPSSYFDAYISLGVIEHFESGQLEMMAEATRVLKKGGVCFISVPFFSPFRRLKAKLFFRHAYDGDDPFFESCLSLEELRYLLAQAGLEYIEDIRINPLMSFIQETPLRPLYGLIEDHRYIRAVIDKVLNFFVPNAVFGHMIMVVAKKI